MAAFIGNSVVIQVMTLANSAILDFAFTAYARDAALDLSTEAVETSHYGTVAKQFIPGMSEGKFSFTIDHDTTTLANSPQKNLEDLYREIRVWNVYPLGVASLLQVYTFSGFVTAAPINLSMTDPVSSDVEVQITGAVTVSTQA
jgi:hypothetical protein